MSGPASDHDNHNDNHNDIVDNDVDVKQLFAIRTITAFVTLIHFDDDTNPEHPDQGHNQRTIQQAISTLHDLQTRFQNAGYVVQTLRIGSNSFLEWMTMSQEDDWDDRVLTQVVAQLTQAGIQFFNVGPYRHGLVPDDDNHIVRNVIPQIIQTTDICSVSVDLTSAPTLSERVALARASAECCQTIAQLPGTHGMGNFRFGVSACCDQTTIPFFPAGAAAITTTTTTGDNHDKNVIQFALGLENGSLAQTLLQQCQSRIDQVNTIFRNGMANALWPLQDICQLYVRQQQQEQAQAQQSLNDANNDQHAPCSIHYAGLDVSLNPSLDATGSVARALEYLVPERLGGPGTLAAVNAVTQALQSLPKRESLDNDKDKDNDENNDKNNEIQRTGYCGLMLPVCEDERLAELVSDNNNHKLQISNLLSISALCGVGVDTVPLPGNVTVEQLQALYLDVAALATRYHKPLSCRVFPLPDRNEGDTTPFDESPYMVNAKIMSLS